MDTQPDKTEGALEALTQAAHVEWSGELTLRAGGQSRGIVTFDHGRIAWAVAADQHEDLATFLWRLGRISQKQVSEVRRQYERYRGARKLGRLLEESGLIKPTVLRRCLLLHTRMALTTVLSLRGLEALWEVRVLSADQEMTFAVKEVLPELLTPEHLPAEEREDPPWWSWHRRNRVLDGLDQIAGFIGSAVCVADGAVLAATGPQERFDPTELGKFLSHTFDEAAQVKNLALFGRSDVTFFQFDYGALAARWVDDGRRALAFLLLDRGGRLETARYGLNAAAPSIARVLRSWEALDGEQPALRGSR